MATGSSGTAPSSAILCEDDLAVLDEALYPARNKYKKVALQIGVKISEIESVEMKENDPGDRLLQILAIRLKKRESLTWKDIDTALRKDSVGESKLADAIRKKHSLVASPDGSSEDEHEKEMHITIPQKEESVSSRDDSSPECDVVKRYQSEMKELVNIFERFFGKLCCVEFSPKDVAAELRRKELISIKEMKHMMKSPESQQDKIISLVDKLHNKIKSHPGHLFEIIEVMLENKALQETAKEMLREAGTLISCTCSALNKTLPCRYFVSC